MTTGFNVPGAGRTLPFDVPEDRAETTELQ